MSKEVPNEMPMSEQMAINIGKKRIDKKVRQMEHDGEERKQAFADNKPLQEKIKKRADEMLKGISKGVALPPPGK